MKKLIISLTAIVWIAFAAFLYFFQFLPAAGSCNFSDGCLNYRGQGWQTVTRESHRYYFEAIKTSFNRAEAKTNKTKPANPVYPIGGALLIFYSVLVIYYKIYKRQEEFSISVRPIYFLGFFVVLFAIVFSRWVSFLQISAPVHSTSIWLKFPTVLLQSLFMIAVPLVVGSKLRMLLLRQKGLGRGGLGDFLIGFALGVVALVALAYLLAAFGVFKSYLVWTIWIVLLLVCYKEAFFWFDYLLGARIVIKDKFFGPLIPLLLIIGLYLAQNFMEILRPLPIGHDDLTTYLNYPKLIAERGQLLNLAYGYSWQLFVASAFVLFKNTTTALATAHLGSIFALLGLYYIVQSYGMKRGLGERQATVCALLAATVFFSLPMVFFQSARDLKVDLPALFFAAGSLLLLMKGFDSYPDDKDIGRRYFYLSAFFLGFAVSVKVTALFFAAGWLAYWLFLAFKRHLALAKIVLLTLTMVGFFLLPLVPYGARNLIVSRAPGRYRLLGTTEKPDIKIEAGTTVFRKVTGEQEELGRYLGFGGGIKRYLLLPIHATTNSLVDGLYVDSSFIYLAFVPLILLFYLKARRKNNEGVDYLDGLILATTVSWLVWIAAGQGVIWYNLSGFIFLSLILVEVLVAIYRSGSKPVIFVAAGFVILWLTLGLFLRLVYLPRSMIGPDPAGIIWARGSFTDLEYIDNKLYPYRMIYERINREIAENPNNPPKVYIAGTYLKYFIDRNDKTTLYDLTVDAFANAHQEQDDQKTLRRLRDSGFKYIIYDKGLYALDQTPDKSLSKKFWELVNFVQHNPNDLQVIFDESSNRTVFVEIK